jgi:hypothetical protein
MGMIRMDVHSAKTDRRNRYGDNKLLPDGGQVGLELRIAGLDTAQNC